MNMMLGGLPLLGIGELPEAISARGAMPCGEERTLWGIGELPEAISVRGAMPCGEESAVAGDRRIARGNLRKGGYAVRSGECRCWG